ncbi:enoyl-CoA hydratase/isomerase family protein [Vallicoccus soli]|uniref:Enoyl-CoA hydratase/isomerase family protein n=1 Tax=Vallicoccus soli TaxID=2339232 RepID=A0A3A3ZK84_9ACTN|nr:enoyl-CoA hydratase-related protein [Vallicoccus soli]RJK96139.1 enoyl-CoA hydratase/isomerase family protein [Vallicoccus soli]
MGTVSLNVDGAVAVLTIDRPERRGALDDASTSALRGLVDEVAGRTGEVRALVLTGSGGAFCAGRDIAGVDPLAEDAGDVLAHVVNPVVERLAGLPVPTVAAVEGPALGVGLGLALACDLVVAAEGARFGSPFGRIGAVLDSGAHLLLAERIGRPRTLELVYTGRLLDGTEAAAWGLANRVVPTGTAYGEALATARTLAAGPTLAYTASKRLLARVRDDSPSLAEVLALEAEAQRRAGATEDYREGFAAFQEKRRPVFRGR